MTLPGHHLRPGAGSQESVTWHRVTAPVTRHTWHRHNREPRLGQANGKYLTSPAHNAVTRHCSSLCPVPHSEVFISHPLLPTLPELTIPTNSQWNSCRQRKHIEYGEQCSYTRRLFMINQREDDLIILCGRCCWLPHQQCSRVWQMEIQRAIERCGETRMSYHISDQTEPRLGLIHRNDDLGTLAHWSLDWAWRVPALYGWRRRRRSRHWTWLSSALPNIHILAANKVKIISFQHPPSHATHNTSPSGRDEEILKNQRVIISNQLTL